NPSGHTVSNAQKRTIKNEGIQLSNAPNPFLGSTQINWRILNQYSHAQLVVTDVMGKTIYTQNITKPIGSIEFDATQLPAGIYYYSIQLDEQTRQTKMMVVL
ncbi:MAG: T9SS type A sorting domain-containing protein, partial [Sphingobacteriales bacterium]|nr:T9SS type A sorting domain-containing protein [Sphingobacteriales bacterium]